MCKENNCQIAKSGEYANPCASCSQRNADTYYEEWYRNQHDYNIVTREMALDAECPSLQNDGN